MKYAFRTQVYDEPLEKSLARLQRFGYDGVELLAEPDKDDANELKRLIGRFGLELCHLNGDFSPGKERDLCNSDPVVRQNTVGYIKRCLELAHQVGAASVAVRPSPEGKLCPTASLGEEWCWAVETLGEVADYAAELGIFVAVEPANRYEVYLVNTVDDALRFVKEIKSSYLGILADCFHMNIEEADISQALRRAGPHLLNVHIADSNRQPIGRGHTDFLSIVRTLKEIGYQGYLTMEPFPPSGLKPSDDLLDAYYEESISILHLYERGTLPLRSL